MTPRTELHLVNAVLAALLTLAGFLVLGLVVSASRYEAMLLRGLLWSVPAMLAALVGTRLGLRAEARVAARGEALGAFGLALRVVLFAFIAYPLLAAAWVLATGFLDVIWQVRPASWRALLGWLPIIVGVATLAALVVGALPALWLETLLCRRYRARLAAAARVARRR